VNRLLHFLKKCIDRKLNVLVVYHRECSLVRKSTPVYPDPSVRQNDTRD